MECLRRRLISLSSTMQELSATTSSAGLKRTRSITSFLFTGSKKTLYSKFKPNSCVFTLLKDSKAPYYAESLQGRAIQILFSSEIRFIYILFCGKRWELQDPLNDTAVTVLKANTGMQLMSDLWSDYQTQEDLAAATARGGKAAPAKKKVCPAAIASSTNSLCFS